MSHVRGVYGPCEVDVLHVAPPLYILLVTLASPSPKVIYPNEERQRAASLDFACESVKRLALQRGVPQYRYKMAMACLSALRNSLEQVVSKGSNPHAKPSMDGNGNVDLAVTVAPPEVSPHHNPHTLSHVT